MKNFIVLTMVMLALSAISGQAAAVNILVTAESDSGSAFHDMSAGDGAQTILTGGAVVVDENPANAAIGSRSISFSRTDDVLGVLEFDGTWGLGLGSEFTLAAFVKPNLDGSIRMFTNYPGSGGVGAGVVLFDCYGGGPDKTMRLFAGGLNNNTPITFNPGVYYHLAATYSHGESKLYVNGSQIGSTGTGGADTPNLDRNLRFGEDTGGAINEQFIGNADDIVILSRVLSDTEIQDLANNGVIGSSLAPFTIAMDPADPNGVELITPSPGQYGEVEGTEITITALASKCLGPDLFEFVRWEGNVADPFSASTSTIVDANDIVTAVYTKTSGACELATLTLGITPEHGDDAGLITPVAGTYKYVLSEQQVIALNAVEFLIECPQIYTFDHWEGDVEDATALSTTVLMDEDKTVTAIYVADDCGTMIEHVGANNPLDEGFDLNTNASDPDSTGAPFVEDGVECWRVTSEDDSLVQYVGLLPAGAFVDPTGWTSTAKIKLIEEGTIWGVSLGVCDGVNNSSMNIRDGAVVSVYLGGQLIKELDTKDDFHTYQIAYDPFSEEFSYFIDGILCLSTADAGSYSVPRVAFGDQETGGPRSDQLISEISLKTGYPDTTQVNITTNQDDAILVPAINLSLGINEIIVGTEITLAAETVFVDVNDIDLANSRQYDFDRWVIDGVTYTTPEVAITVDTAVDAQAFYNNVAATLYEVTIAIEGDGNDPNLTEPDPGTFTVVKYATDIVTATALPIKIDCPGILDFIHWDANGSVVDTAYQTQVLIEENTTLTAVFQARTILGSCGTINIPVVNGDFEDPDVGVGHTAAGTIPGWSIDAGSFNWIEKRKYIGSYDSQVALVGGGSSEKRISQVLSAGVSPSTEYAISVDLINSNYPGLAPWMFTDWAVRLETVDGEVIAQMNGATHGYPPLNEEGVGDSLPYNVIGTGVTGSGDRDSRVGKEMRIAIIVPPAEYLILVDNVEIGATGQLFDLTVDADPNYVEITPAVGSYTFIEGTTVTLKTDKATLDCPDFLVFDQWVGADVADPLSSTTEIVVDGNKSVTATYAVADNCEELGLYLRNPGLDEPALAAGVSQSSVWGVPAGFWVPTLATIDDSCGISNQAESMFDSPSPNSGGQFGIIHTADVMTNNVYQVIGATFCDGQTYTVSADLGWPNQDSWQFTEYSISLVSAKTGEIVAQATHENQSPALPDPNNWITVTASGVASGNVDGDKIKVVVGGYNSEDFAYDSIRVAGPSVMVSLTMSADPEIAADSVTPEGETSYPFPAMVAIDADDAVDCPDRLVFAEWAGGDVVDPESASTMVKMDEDKALVALYDRQEAYYNECGDICHPYPYSDRTEDCVVNLQDLAWLGERWMLPVALVRNGDFESPYIAPGSSTRGPGSIDNWNQDVQYMYHDHRGVTIFGAEGINDGAWLTVWPSTAKVSQILTEPVAPDEEYTFMLDVGMSQHWVATTGYSARLETVDGEVLVEIDETDGMPGVNQIITLSESATTGPEGTDPRVGKDMRVVLTITEGGNAGIIYDNVKVLFSGMYDIEDLYLMAEEWLTDIRP